MAVGCTLKQLLYRGLKAHGGQTVKTRASEHSPSGCPHPNMGPAYLKPKVCFPCLHFLQLHRSCDIHRPSKTSDFSAWKKKRGPLDGPNVSICALSQWCKLENKAYLNLCLLYSSGPEWIIVEK